MWLIIRRSLKGCEVVHYLDKNPNSRYCVGVIGRAHFTLRAFLFFIRDETLNFIIVWQKKFEISRLSLT